MIARIEEEADFEIEEEAEISVRVREGPVGYQVPAWAARRVPAVRTEVRRGIQISDRG
jgi:hypothetical protein